MFTSDIFFRETRKLFSEVKNHFLVSPKQIIICKQNLISISIIGRSSSLKSTYVFLFPMNFTGLRLIQVTQRKSKKVQNNLQSLANEAQFLVLNRSSAQSLFKETQENLEQNQNIDWILEQFRGNLVLDGCDPYDENVWKQIQIPVKTSTGKTAVESILNLEVHGLCTRCNVIGVNQANSERVQEPLQTLAKSESKRFKFGILAGSKISMEGLVLKIGSVVRTVS